MTKIFQIVSLNKVLYTLCKDGNLPNDKDIEKDKLKPLDMSNLFVYERVYSPTYSEFYACNLWECVDELPQVNSPYQWVEVIDWIREKGPKEANCFWELMMQIVKADNGEKYE